MFFYNHQMDPESVAKEFETALENTGKRYFALNLRAYLTLLIRCGMLDTWDKEGFVDRLIVRMFAVENGALKQKAEDGRALWTQSFSPPTWRSIQDVRLGKAHKAVKSTTMVPVFRAVESLGYSKSLAFWEKTLTEDMPFISQGVRSLFRIHIEGGKSVLRTMAVMDIRRMAIPVLSMLWSDSAFLTRARSKNKYVVAEMNHIHYSAKPTLSAEIEKVPLLLAEYIVEAGGQATVQKQIGFDPKPKGMVRLVKRVLGEMLPG